MKTWKQPTKYVDTKLIYSDDRGVITEINCNKRKLLVRWPWDISKMYERNAIITDSNRGSHISSNITKEIQEKNSQQLIIGAKFVNCKRNQYNIKPREQRNFIIPAGFSQTSKQARLVEIPHCVKK